MSAQPAVAEAGLGVAELIEEYERATAAERLAWLALRNCLESHRTGADAWNAWRDAVERTQRAVRNLVDRGERAAS